MGFDEELCVITLKGVAKVRAKLTFVLKNDVRNLLNFQFKVILATASESTILTILKNTKVSKTAALDCFWSFFKGWCKILT